jgi:hypothetical protein
MTAVIDRFSQDIELELLQGRQLFHWSIERYQEAIVNGTLTDEDRVELLFGTIIDKMPIYSPHSACVSKTKRYLTRRFPDSEIRTENPIVLPYDSMPEPDCVIAAFREDYYVNAHPVPNDIHVVIEVADSTVRTDRTIKRAAYAVSGLDEFWIINIAERQLELHLTANVQTGHYQQVVIYSEAETFESPFAGSVAVVDLLPPPPND